MNLAARVARSAATAALRPLAGTALAITAWQLMHRPDTAPYGHLCRACRRPTPCTPIPAQRGPHS